MVKKIDLLIIGAGPAGLSTALHLVRFNTAWAKRMLVIEKAVHPRPKLCAGGVTRIGLQSLRDLGLSLPLPIPGVQVTDARLICNNKTINVRGQPMFTVYNRIELDDFISQYAQKRGVNIYQKEAVEAIEEKPDGLVVITEKDSYFAQVVVGADGSKGISLRLFTEAGCPKRVARVLEADLNVHGTEAHFSKACAEFNFSACQQHLQGYTWEFPSRIGNQPRFNRGVYDSRLVKSRPRADLPLIFNTQMEQDGVESSVDIQGHPIHLFHPKNRFSRPHLLLVGDAAGVDPLFGEGIGPSLAYGRLAAETINDSFLTQDFSFSDYKYRLMCSRLGRYLLIRWLVARLSYLFSGSVLFMNALWIVGRLAAELWPKPSLLYAIGNSYEKRDPMLEFEDYAD